ncbi:MAG: hypothetical protein CVV24_11530 [Ignavibacteriae bacterium HGW-Ignavibacteriae-3]|nr:MAG: hypothetical protein CVV24_11530 [Ignavibacteriae bacterium HGW-Ignavibacteriae-3]
MEIFDLAISYKWKYDREFVSLIEHIFQKEGLRTFIINEFNSAEVIELLKKKKLFFKAYLDRASDEDPDFLPLIKILTRKKSYIINPHSKIVKSVDKYLMHKRLLRKSFVLPKTFLLPSFDHDETLRLKESDLNSIGKPFIIKPALFSGGGQGVIKNAESIEEIMKERRINHYEKYIVQEKIYPRNLQRRRAWFRVLWAFGNVIPTWWDDNTHVYHRVTKTEVTRHNLLPLFRITKRLARMTQLDYFSTEIALTKDHKFVLIDYINDQCDMRLKSNHTDGVPDSVVKAFISAMKKKVLAL